MKKFFAVASVLFLGFMLGLAFAPVFLGVDGAQMLRQSIYVAQISTALSVAAAIPFVFIACWNQAEKKLSRT